MKNADGAFCPRLRLLARPRQPASVVENADWLAVVPFWAVWPFETMILPRQRRIRNLAQLTEPEQAGLADVLRRLLLKYDNLFKCARFLPLHALFRPLFRKTYTCARR